MDICDGLLLKATKAVPVPVPPCPSLEALSATVVLPHSPNQVVVVALGRVSMVMVEGIMVIMVMGILILVT